MGPESTDRARAVEAAWFGSGQDVVDLRRQLLAVDVEARSKVRAELLPLLDLAVTALVERMEALSGAASQAHEPLLAVDLVPEPLPTLGHADPLPETSSPAAGRKRKRRRSQKTTMVFAAPTLEEDEQPAPAAVSHPEPEPEPEPEPDPVVWLELDEEPEPEPESEPEPEAEFELEPRDAGEPETPARARYLAPEIELLPDGSSGWQTFVELLYNDVLRLFRYGDTDGALASLERMLILAPMDTQIRQFLSVNEEKLVNLYEVVMGPWTNVLQRVEIPSIPKILRLNAELFRTVLHLVDGKRSLAAVIEESYFGRVETCAVLHQLIRAKVLVSRR